MMFELVPLIDEGTLLLGGWRVMRIVDQMKN